MACTMQRTTLKRCAVTMPNPSSFGDQACCQLCRECKTAPGGKPARGWLHVQLHAWRWVSEAHGSGSWELSCRNVIDDYASVMAYDSVILLAAGSMLRMLLSTACVAMPPPTSPRFTCRKAHYCWLLSTALHSATSAAGAAMKLLTCTAVQHFSWSS
jgi:hypothetical protein